MKTIALALGLFLASGGVVAAEYHPLGPAYLDDIRIQYEHYWDAIREERYCRVYPKHEVCDMWRERQE